MCFITIVSSQSIPLSAFNRLQGHALGFQPILTSDKVAYDRNVSYHQILKVNRINCDFQLLSPLAQELPVSLCQCFDREEVTKENIVFETRSSKIFRFKLGPPMHHPPTLESERLMSGGMSYGN